MKKRYALLIILSLIVWRLFSQTPIDASSTSNQEEVLFYPNPANEGYITIVEPSTFVIMDALGNALIMGTTFKNDERVDISSLPDKAFYFLQFKNGKTKRFAKGS